MKCIKCGYEFDSEDKMEESETSYNVCSLCKNYEEWRKMNEALK